MKPTSIRHRKVLLICLVLFCGMAAILGALCLFQDSRKTEGSFFEIAGFAPEAVDSVTICYEDASVELSETDRQRLLDSLTTTQGQLLDYDHEYPYHLTQLPLQFHVGDEVFEYPMAWFSGYEYQIEGSGDEAKYTTWIDYVDRRVDVQIAGHWFSFRQTGESFWNEDISSTAYGAANRRIGMSSASASVGGYRYVKDRPDFSDPSYYAYSADLVVIATLTGQEYHPDPDYRIHTYPTYYFTVDEVLKGEYNSDEPLTADWNIGTPILQDGSEYVPPYDDVMMGGTDNHYEYLQEGRQYLLFYESNPHYETVSAADFDSSSLSFSERQPYYPLTQCSFTYWLAAVYGDKVYPVVNHESHAFYEMPLEEVRSLCDTYNVHGFFDVVGFTKENVTNISICYKGVSQDLQESDRQRLLDSLQGAQGSIVKYDHEYPYHVSDYQIQLHVGNEVYEFPFAWFSGFEYVVMGSGDEAYYSSLIEYTDRRVDVQIDGNWYTFQQAKDVFWNEDVSYMAYYTAEDANQDFSSQASSSSEFGTVKDSPDYADPKYFVYHAPLIVVAKHSGREYIPAGDSYMGYYEYAVDEFEVTEVLKGEYDTDEMLSLTGLSRNLKSETAEEKTSPRLVMQGGLIGGWCEIGDVGDTYLLFLDYNFDSSSDEWEIDYFRNSSYSLARIFSDTAYAALNHENHAFFELPLQELRNLCEECILNENHVYGTSFDASQSSAAVEDSLAAAGTESPFAAADVTSFVKSSIQACLQDAASENYVFSPANLYLGLGLLAETTGSDTRTQILSVLGSSNTAALRSRVSSIYNANQLIASSENTSNTSALSNSLWLDEFWSLDDHLLGSLAAQYQTSAYRGDMNSISFRHFFRDWTQEQTQYYTAPEESLPCLEPTVSFLSTTYTNIAWEEPFSLLAYSEETFFAADREILCEFMHQNAELDYYRGEHFSAISKPLASGGAVQFILPDADTSVDSLLNDDEVLDLMTSDLIASNLDSEPRIDYVTREVNLSIPKFTLFCNTDLASPLKSLGITNIFDDQKADFSPITYFEDSLSLSQLLHVNRVILNPNGCVDRPEDLDPFTAPEFTKGDGIDFVVDRPFLFIVTGSDGMPLLAGAIYEPEYFQRSYSILYH